MEAAQRGLEESKAAIAAAAKVRDEADAYAASTKKKIDAQLEAANFRERELQTARMAADKVTRAAEEKSERYDAATKAAMASKASFDDLIARLTAGLSAILAEMERA
jgi:hypothetical protein